MLNYFIYTIITLACSYSLYILLLRRQTTFQFNRFFLLGSIFVCFLSPFLEFEILNSVPSITEISIEDIETPLKLNTDKIDLNNKEPIVLPSNNLSVFLCVYVVFTLLFVLRFFKNIFKICKLTNNEHDLFMNLKLIKTNDKDLVSSFFNYVFLNENYALTKTEYLNILKHESVHSKQLHTIDVLILELFVCVFWFNPFLWLFRKVILQNHEFIADQVSVYSGIDIEGYSNTIINLGQQKYSNPLASGFNFTQIKNRIIMLHKAKSSLSSIILNVFSVLIFLGAIFVFSSYKDIKEPLIVVIDAGHGGQDYGSIGLNEVNEKEITLDISKKLLSYSNEKVKIILTRNTDNFKSLKDRTNFINSLNADLLISLHCNSSKNASANGVEAYIFNENDIKKSAYNYSEILINNMTAFSNSRGVKQTNLYLLKNVNCPAILMELGFLTNKKDKSILTNELKRKEIAKSIFESLKEIRRNK